VENEKLRLCTVRHWYMDRCADGNFF
jgi:hypothetical protein